MTQTTTTAQSSSSPPSQDMKSALDQVAHAKLKVTKLEVRLNQLSEQSQRTSGLEQAGLNQQWAQAKLDYVRATSELASAERRLEGLTISHQDAVPVSAAPSAPAGPTTTITVPPFQVPVISDGVAFGGTLLLLPLVVALARRIWTRNGPRAVAPDLESSPRLQRIEQAIESIAVEVERIGEAQRFTTKLLVARQQDVGMATPLVQPSRQAPGSITPH